MGDPLRLQQILGHTSLEMVRRYVAMANVQQSLVEAHTSPMDLIAGGRVGTAQARYVQPREVFWLLRQASVGADYAER